LSRGGHERERHTGSAVSYLLAAARSSNGILRFCTIFHTNMGREAWKFPILYDYSYKQAPRSMEISDFVRLFIQTHAAKHGNFRFCTIFRTNMGREAWKFPILYDFSYKQAPRSTEFSDFVRFFV